MANKALGLLTLSEKERKKREKRSGFSESLILFSKAGWYSCVRNYFIKSIASIGRATKKVVPSSTFVLTLTSP